MMEWSRPGLRVRQNQSQDEESKNLGVIEREYTNLGLVLNYKSFEKLC
jgi:hypothetical protein